MMKKYGAFLAVLFISIITVQAQVSEIKGVSKKQKGEKVRLFKVVCGRMVPIATAAPGANGAFSFQIKPEYKGYYAIGFGDSAESMDKYKLYIKGNDKVSLELNDQGYALTGANTKENQVLFQWYKLAYDLERKSVYYNRGSRSMSSFFPELEKVVAKSENWTVGKETGNADFDELMKLTVDYDVAYFTMAFLVSPRAAQPNPKDYTAYVKNFTADKYLQNEELFKFPYGSTMLVRLVSFKNDKFYDSDLAKSVTKIPNDALKGEYVLCQLGTVRSYANYQEIQDAYGKYFLEEDQLNRVRSIEYGLQIYKPGKDAFNFTYPDVNNNPVSLTDFKGKVVLVDVWATWCGPCQKEMPFLKQLEDDLHGTDVVFLGVSVDVEKDKKKWKNFVAAKNLGGVQILASGGHKIKKDYGISGIPRFMVFDKNGKIVNVDAPRPSDPKLKDVLLAELKK